MTDISLKITVRNARLLHAIEERYGSQAKFARDCGLGKEAVNALVTMRTLPYTPSTGKWTEAALTVAGGLGRDPVDFWPEHMRAMKIKRATRELTVSLSDVRALMAPAESTDEHRRLLDAMSATLTSREASVIAERMTGATLDDLVKIHGVSKERIRQLESKALTKMKQLAAARLGIKSMEDIE